MKKTGSKKSRDTVPLSYSCWKFQKICAGPILEETKNYFSKPCFCHLRTHNCIVIVSEANEKIRENCKPVLNAINSLPTVQISQGIVALFEKIFDGEQILIGFSLSGEAIHHLCFIQFSVLCENCVSTAYWWLVCQQLLYSNKILRKFYGWMQND